MPNRLALVTSPYLQQHAGNPVDWYEWGAEALQRARDEDKPILLSIGYSACHWCHVMAHESFEDAEVAAVMNALFINIKVDREERPDLDQIYQTAHWMLTQRGGGWPLTMFLTPDHIPFFGGTYFPKTARFNLPGFQDLLQRVAAFYRENRAAIATQNASLVGALDSMLPRAEGSGELSAAPLQRALTELQDSFDGKHGGFGAAPKFPHPSELGWCLRQWTGSGDERARDMALFTLERMSAGGIYDQLGGGFSRYSVDASWTIPHFEKMLYDNAPLLALLTDAWLITGAPRFKEVAEETAAWVMREMQSAEGGYFSSIDADSEHEEGKFYVWSRAEVLAALTEQEFALVAPYYGLDQAPNFEDHAWHLRLTQPLPELAAQLGIALAEAETRLRGARHKLFALREQRVRPGRDDKVLTSWNALMIKAMLRAGRVFNRADWTHSALRALEFVRGTLWRAGRLLATYRDGQAALNAYLDDYAFLLDALLESIQARFRGEDLSFAREIAEVLLTQFEDRTHGGFHFTSHDHEQLIHRPKPGQDNATPSGNAVAAYALQRLGHLIGEPRYLAAAERTLGLFYPALQQHASGFATLLMALEEYLIAPRIVVLRGPEEELKAWQQALAQQYLPGCMIVAVSERQDTLPATLSQPVDAHVNAWICQGVTCLPPIGDLSELIQVCNAARTAV